MGSIRKEFFQKFYCKERETIARGKMLAHRSTSESKARDKRPLVRERRKQTGNNWMKRYHD
jgi:hypothetical protein